MVQLSNKTFIAVIAAFVIIAIVSVLIAMNFNGWGTALSGVGGPVASTILAYLKMPAQWVANGGWPQMITALAIAVVCLFGAGYLFEQKQIYATITGKSTIASPATGYDNTMRREPEEPERQPIAPKAA